MNDELLDALERAQHQPMTPAEKEAQRRSFVYGNVSLSNEDVTRELVDEVADSLATSPPPEAPTS